MMSHLRPGPDPDGEALARRLLARRGIAPGALMLPAADVVSAIAEARFAGALIAAAWADGWRHCRVCGCTDLATCRGEDPCSWVERDLCSACAPFVDRCDV